MNLREIVLFIPGDSMVKYFFTLLVLIFFIGCSKKSNDEKTAQKSGPQFHASLFTDAPKLIDKNGKYVKPDYIQSQKHVVLYFSASWCGPCHRFNPIFIKWYNDNGGKKNFEVILVGRDADAISNRLYMKDSDFPWVAFEMDGKKFNEIVKKYCGKGIPCVAVLDENDNVVAHSYEGENYVGPMPPLEKLLEISKK